MNDHENTLGFPSDDFPDFPDFEETSTHATTLLKTANPALNLGSDDTEDDIFDDEDSEEIVVPATIATAVAVTKPAPVIEIEVAENPLEAAIDAVTFGSIFVMPPVFEYGAVTEDIADMTQTFDAFRLSKIVDFPELEDVTRVTWGVTYGKTVESFSGADAKKKQIGEVKSAIEASKEFKDALKKSKDKSPRCVVKPRVTAQSKGDAIAAYKGVFTSVEDAERSGKIISIVPARDGYVYEIRREEIGTFTTRTANYRELSEVAAGFIPALPRVPQELLLEIISFFRSFMGGGESSEAIVNVLWDKEFRGFCTYVPPQVVSHDTATSDLAGMPPPERFLHYMDVHSHNEMAAKFSKTDDNDEKATRVYAVIGRLDRFLPEISVRISNGGKYLSIEPAIVFEPLVREYPAIWHDSVTVADSARFAA
ncbi:MAG: hypothetical protein LBN30_09675 [Oscillospiraceae bacterium]|jgi:hypothetical protein|nr:hypothetical protein [Oscillospiraceae bacterium]